MLDISDTGYEGKFDFPPREGPPEIFYLLATVPRTGSTWFSHMLWQTGCLGAPLEYLNFDQGGPYFFARSSASMQRDLWRSVLRRRTSPNGVFGLKCFPTQLDALGQSNPALIAGIRPSHLIYLGRRDRAAHVVSLARAAMSGIWNQKQAQGREVSLDYSQEALEASERGIAAQEAAWDRLFESFGIAPLRLWYEDALADPAEAARQVADHLSVAIDPAAQVRVPAIEKQGGAESMAWAERYARSKAGSS